MTTDEWIAFAFFLAVFVGLYAITRDDEHTGGPV
jgi:hypothetical protein